jgi:protein-disulfide isomerase
MTFNKNEAGNALPLVLVILLVVAVGVGAWFVMKKTAPSEEQAPAAAQTTAPATNESQTATPPVTEGTAPADTTTPTVVPAPEESDAPAATDEAANAPVSEETGTDTTATPETETAKGDVKIDVKKALGLRAIGNPNAPIKVVEYASLTCSHCAHFYNDIMPQLKTKYIDTGKVYFEFRDFPLNDPALKGTLTARCLPEDKYEGFVALLYKTQDQWAGGMDYMQSLKQNAKLAGMSDETFDACQNEPALKLELAKMMQEAKDKWNISATPTFVINDGKEVISGAVPLEEFERVFRKVSGDGVGEAPPVE